MTEPDAQTAIYADHAATSPCRPEVAALVAELLGATIGNASSRHHAAGRRSRQLLDRARDQVAALIGARPDEIVFTSGATEACNLALIGCMQRLIGSRPGLVIGATEHPAVVEPARWCSHAGADLCRIPVDRHGAWQMATADKVIIGRIGLVAGMLVNNETGVRHPVADLATAAHTAGALFFCDATQAVGREHIDVTELGCDLLAISGHKFGGPPGTGALYIRRGLALTPLQSGGGQEHERRAGTENIPGIAGFGLACERAAEGIAATRTQLQLLTTRLEDGLRTAIPELVIYGAGTARTPGTTFCGIPGLRRGLLAQLGPIAASGGSSCASTSGKPSAVLRAMGVSAADANNAVRISFATSNTPAEVDRIIEQVRRGVERLRTATEAHEQPVKRQ